MPLYTVTISFEDRTFATEQVEAESPETALKSACQQAEALHEHDAKAIEDMLQNHVRSFQVAQLRGVWIWWPAPHDQNEATADIFGGIIVQTDQHAPVREQRRESL